MNDSQTLNIFLTCPHCGDRNFIRRDDGFECAACGEFSYTEDMCSEAKPIKT